ncbi:MAG TPA: type III-B CRISPR module RAMP protein Cmr6 [Acidobacteriota bacterium]|nr:type III-B CRISPR module RAMP protein Cmr6 [Acidobacteriota bacterium]
MKMHMAKDVAAVLGGNASECRNVSLLAAKFPGLPDDERDKQSRGQFLSQLCRVPLDPQGREVRARFLESILPAARRSVFFRGKLQSRLIVNQAGGVIENAGLCLDPHFGIPYIPGSALKGIARAAALSLCKEQKADIFEILAVFGWAPGAEDLRLLEDGGASLPYKAFSGTVAFLAAYPVSECRLVLDVVTCHHGEYYRDLNIPMNRQDTEAPVPNVFPTIEGGCQFGFTLVCCDQARVQEARTRLSLSSTFDPLEAAKKWLVQALTDHGVGAKTAAGYGWFTIEEDRP